MTLELTTRFRGISTSPKGTASRNTGAQTSAQAVSRGMANLRYITRESANADVVWFGAPARKAIEGIDPDAADSDRLKALHGSMEKALTERAQEGGKAGRMVATKITISLPNSWPESAQDQALVALGNHFAPPDSEALAVGALHRDKPQNRHLHFLVKDGRESEHAALMRLAHDMAKGAPSPKRVRRRDVNRFNADLGRPKQVRAEIANILNSIADQQGLERVEHETFKKRGIDKTASHHRGPALDAQQRRTQRQHEQQWYDGGTYDGIAAPESKPAKKAVEKPEPTPRTIPIPQPATVPLAPQPVARKVLVKGRWITVTSAEEKPAKKRKNRGDEQR